jgi:hypothetical protein
MTFDSKTYPVNLRGDLSLPPGRLLWLVKWLLIIPHVFVLFFLGFASAVLTFIAFFAILFTGKYPKGMFDFNVGVLRWGWRVGFYSYSALGTDRYPPFSLEPDPNYPADLTIPYPEKLSRGLIFVKWLLAFPHWIVIMIFNGLRGPGIVTLLAILNAVIMLFTGRITGELFNVCIGMNRWTNRVMAYVCLFRDEYPPFRLDE